MVGKQDMYVTLQAGDKLTKSCLFATAANVVAVFQRSSGEFFAKQGTWKLFIGEKVPVLGCRFAAAVSMAQINVNPPAFGTTAPDSATIFVDFQYNVWVWNPIMFTKTLLAGSNKKQEEILLEIANNSIDAAIRAAIGAMRPATGGAKPLTATEIVSEHKYREHLQLEVNKRLHTMLVEPFGIKVDFRLTEITPDESLKEARTAIEIAQANLEAAELQAQAQEILNRPVKDLLLDSNGATIGQGLIQLANSPAIAAVLRSLLTKGTGKNAGGGSQSSGGGKNNKRNGGGGNNANNDD